MLDKYLKTLEYTKILENLAAFAAFATSRNLIEALKPSPDYDEVLNRQQETTEARRLLSIRPGISVSGVSDLRPLVDQSHRGMLILPVDLLQVRKTLVIARDLERVISRLADQVPLLADIATRLPDVPGVINEITRCIDDNGEVKSNASPALAQIRRDIDIAHNRLFDRLRQLIGSERYREYLQEAIITQRDGRYVVPLKANFKGRIRGVVHGQSGSGATIYVEPLAVVELNNQWRQLQLQEEEEINRILLALSGTISQHGDEIIIAVENLAALDLVLAKARYAESLRATAPQMVNWDTLQHKPNPDTGRLILKAARHPLLDQQTVVPIDLTLDHETSMLVITGPNTGGKTVSLKTVGLLAMMAQAGLHLPVKQDSCLAVFDGIFADIGDEQSLEQSLSTFSGHMTNIVTILAHCTPHSLVIFDELGAGTDPLEGAGLAQAILEKLRNDGVTTIVATHFAELKAYAYTTPGVTNASMAFDLETLAPTYRLQIGLPGSSNAFTIAGRLGLAADIISAAESTLSHDSRETETMIQQIQQELETARVDRLRLDEELAEAEFYRRKMEQQLSEIQAAREQMLAEAQQEAQEAIQETRHQLEQIKTEASRAAHQAAREAQRQEINATMQAAGAKLEAVGEALKPRPKPGEKSQGPTKQHLKVGDTVDIPRFNAQGVVTALGGREVEVQLGHFRTTVALDEVKTTRDDPEPIEAISKGSRAGTAVESPGLELDLRGQVSVDAQLNLEGYLDQAYLAGLPFVRIIHGKGTGVLKRMVRDALQTHPLVSSYKPGQANEGGDGVTVARLALE